MAGPTDAAAFKEQQRRDWDDQSQSWQAYDARQQRNAAETTRRMLELAGVQPGHRVLDVASGTGEPGLTAANVVGPSGRVLLTDQSPGMLAVAESKARSLGLGNVEFQVCDAEELRVDPESFDAALCRGALCLMPDAVACLRLMYGALKPGGRLAVLVVGRPAANPYFTTAYLVLSQYVDVPPFDPDAPGTFRFSDPDRLRSVIAEAGFREVHIEDIEQIWQLPSGRDYWEFMSGFGLIASLLEQLPAERHKAVGDEVAERVTGGNPDAPAELAGEALIAAAAR